jgi:quinol monooxygenase YgiN
VLSLTAPLIQCFNFISKLESRFDSEQVIKFVEMDEKVTLSKQMEENVEGSVIVINKFNVKPEDIDQFVKEWASGVEIMKWQPGYISTQLHRGIADSCVFINYQVWESTELLKKAFNNPEFQSKLSDYPSSTVASPHLFKKVAVPGICVD